MKTEEIQSFCPASREAWRQWLEENHRSSSSVWLVCYKQKSGKPVLPWSDAVDEALCFGWIDSIRKTVDEEKFIQFFSKRKPNGTWSKINKDKIELLIASGKMAPAGLESIEKAKENGSWNILDVVDTLEVPEDLSAALKSRNGAEDFFLGLSKSVRKAMLQWLVFAKRPETRQKRIDEIATLASERKKPKQF